MNDAKSFNGYVKKYLAPVLKEQGFRCKANKFVRVKDNGTINCIVLQKNKYGGSFTLEVGVTYSFLPTPLNEKKELSTYDVYDCEFRKRIGNTEWYEYGKDESDAQKVITEVTRIILEDGFSYFELLEGYSTLFSNLTVEDATNLDSLKKLGIGTEQRLVLTAARINTYIKNKDKADEFISWGLVNSIKDSKIYKWFEELV